MRTLISSSSGPLLPFAIVKAHCRLDDDDTTFDDVLDAYIAAAEAFLEARLGRPLRVQTWSQTFGKLDAYGYLTVEGGPACEIQSLEIMVSGAYALQSATNWAGRPLNRFATLVRKVKGTVWPSPDEDEAAYRVTYQIGEAVLPSPIQAAALLIIGDLFTNREAKVTANLIVNSTVEMLLAPFAAPSV